MRNLKVVETLPNNFDRAFSELLYTQSNFLIGNNQLPQLHFYLQDTSELVCLGHIGFSLLEGQALSPFKAPFGGFSLSQDVGSTEISFFIFEVLRKLKDRGVHLVEIKTAPGCYDKSSNLLVENMRHIGFSQLDAFEYQAIPISGDDYERCLDKMELRKLAKCRNESFEFGKLPKHKLADVFDFIKTQRENKQYEFSMEWTELKLAQKLNSETYVPFVVKHNEKIIAATIGIMATNKILYNFSPAHHQDYDQFSPVVMLSEGLYNYCQFEQLKFLDLGTSYLKGKINEGLYQFKSRLGGQAYFSFSFRKALS